jgi:hypothetical protein
MKKCRKFWRRWRTKEIGSPLQGKDYFQDDYRGCHARVLPTATMAQAHGLTVFVRYEEQILFATSQAASAFAKALARQASVRHYPYFEIFSADYCNYFVGRNFKAASVRE